MQNFIESDIFFKKIAITYQLLIITNVFYYYSFFLHFLLWQLK